MRFIKLSKKEVSFVVGLKEMQPLRKWGWLRVTHILL